MSKKTDVGCVTLLCHKHVRMFILTYCSFILKTGKFFKILIINDGSLTVFDKFFLRIIFKADFLENNKKNVTKYKSYQNLNKFLKDKNLHTQRLKINAYLHSPFNKTIFLDSDIIFYKKPKEILLFLENKIDNFYFSYTHPKKGENVHPTFKYRKELFKKIKIDSDEYFNAGCFSFNKINKNDLSLLDKVASVMYADNYFNTKLANTSEETLLSSLTYHKIPLPTHSYKTIVFTDEYNKLLKNKCIAVHYALNCKKYFWRDFLRII